MSKWNVEKVSKELGITPMTLWRWRKAGKFPQPVKKVGREYFWEKEQIEPFMKDGELKMDELNMGYCRLVDKLLEKFEALPEDNPTNNALACVQSTREELARRLGLSRMSTFEDVASEIDVLKSQLDSVKKALG